MADAVIHTKVQGEDIDTFIHEKLLPVVDGVRLDLVAAACLTLIVTSMVPDMDAEDVARAVQNTAAYLITELSDTGEVVN